MSKNILPIFTSKSFMVSGLRFRSLINFEFIFFLSFFLFFVFFAFSRATPTAYGGSQIRGLIRAVAAGLL